MTRARLNLIVREAILRSAKTGRDPVDYLVPFAPALAELVARTNPKLHGEISEALNARRKRLQ